MWRRALDANEALAERYHFFDACPNLWAARQMNLGSVWVQNPKGEYGRPLIGRLDAYKAALTVYSASKNA